MPVIALRIPKVGELSRKEREENRPLFDTRRGAKLIDDWKRLEKASRRLRGRCASWQKPRWTATCPVIVAGDAAAQLGRKRHQGRGPALGTRDLDLLGSRQPSGELAKRYADRHGAFAVTDAVLASRAALRFSGRWRRGLRPIWVTDFPMFEFDQESQRWTPAHHPFTSPHEEDMDRLVSDPASVRARYYDLAMNGLELGSGSIRIHRQDVQQQIFRALGMSEEEAKARFGFFLKALTYGTPPHGGIALGLDRIVMILAGAQSLREVIAFPKTAKAIDLMVDAPTPVSEQQLKELHIRTVLEGVASRCRKRPTQAKTGLEWATRVGPSVGLCGLPPYAQKQKRA